MPPGSRAGPATRGSKAGSVARKRCTACTDAQELHGAHAGTEQGPRILRWSTACTAAAMVWLVMWIGLLIVSAGGVIISAHSLAFERGVNAEMRALEKATHTAQSPPPMRSETPAVVERYLARAGADGAPVLSAQMQHGGAMRATPDASWMPVRGRQLFVADPPGFVWWGRMRVAPGLWVDARDKLAAGTASMQILAESTFPLGDVASPQLDEGAALRVLGEMVLFPTSFRDPRYVRWESVDDVSARGVLRLGEHEVSALFEFGSDGLPSRVSAKRYRDVRGVGVLTPWYGTFSDYREIDGLRIPFHLRATWELESGPFDAIDFTVEEIHYRRGKALPGAAGAS